MKPESPKQSPVHILGVGKNVLSWFLRSVFCLAEERREEEEANKEERRKRERMEEERRKEEKEER